VALRNYRWVTGQLQWKSGDLVTPQVADKVRGDLAIETITAVVEKGAGVIVVDGVNNRPFRQALERRNVLIFDETEKGISPSRQQGFRIADFMPDKLANLWTEPEKVSIVKDCLEPIMRPILLGQADLVIPFRDNDSFATFPEYQAEVAREANRQWNGLLIEQGLRSPGDSELDVWFGPLGWRKDITDLFLRRYKVADSYSGSGLVRPDEYCNANYFPIIAALTAGKRVLSVEVSYRHPKILKVIEDNNPAFNQKRDDQLHTIIETTKYYLEYVRGDNSMFMRSECGGADGNRTRYLLRDRET
jgi:hypothetical protein